MQSLRHYSRRALHLSGPSRSSLRALSTQTSSSKIRRSKEEKYGLAVKFVERFKASNDGKLPGITALRKEIGGSYDDLKNIMESIQKDDPSCTVASDIRKTKNKEEQPSLAIKNPSEKNSSLNVGKEKDTPQEKVLNSNKVKEKNPQDGGNLHSGLSQVDQNRGLKDVGNMGKLSSSIRKKSVPNASEKNAMNQHKKPANLPKGGVVQSVSFAKATLRHGVIDSDKEDDDSDVAAPEYSHKGNQSEQVVNCQSAMKLKDVKSGPAKVKKIEAADVNTKSQVTKAKSHEAVNGNLSGSNAVIGASNSKLGLGDVTDSNRLATVFRISNLPLQASEESVRALCETIASVHDLEVRKKGTVDVQFNIRNDSEARAVLDRLRSATLEKRNLKAFIAPRFYCGKNAEKQLKPHDANKLKYIRDTALNNFEQCFRQLYARVQDYRELMAMKRDI